MKQLLVLFGYLAVLASLGASQEGSVVIQVNCPDSIGCFRLLGEAIEGVPEGATIQLGSGVFYELPIVVSKTLTIRGTRNASEPQIIETTINAVQSGALITMRNSDHTLSAIFEDLRLQSNGRGFNIEGAADGDAAQLTVSVRDSALLTGDAAIDVHGKVLLTLQGNEVESHPVFVNAADGSELSVYDNKIVAFSQVGTSGGLVVSLQDVEARFERNSIYEREAPRKLVGISALGGRYSFIGNELDEHLVGVVLGGKLSADFQRNVFRENSTGIVLLLSPCRQGDIAPELRFNGTITGSDNQFLYNSTSDFCPALNEFPWPPGFTKP